MTSNTEVEARFATSGRLSSNAVAFTDCDRIVATRKPLFAGSVDELARESEFEHGPSKNFRPTIQPTAGDLFCDFQRLTRPLAVPAVL